MANVKISDLTGAASASGTQEFEVNDSGTSKKVTGSQLATFIEGEVSSSPTLTGQVSLDNGTNTAPSLTNTGDTNTGLYFPSDDTVGLAAGGGLKLSANASGIDVTGTVTADGLTSVSVVDTQGKFSGWSVLGSNGASGAIELGQDSPYQGIISYAADASTRFIFDNTYGSSSSTFEFRSNTSATPKTHMKITGGGDISFYEDTGTTPKFFWDASAGALGIGTSSPDGTLHVHAGSAGTITAAAAAKHLVVENNGAVGMSLLSDDAANNAYGVIYWGNETDGSADGRITYFGSTYAVPADRQSMAFSTAATERMRIDSSGNLLVGKTSLNTTVDGVELRGGGQLAVTKDGSWVGNFNRKTSDGDIVSFQKDGSTVGSIGAQTRTGNTELGIGTGDTGLNFFNQGDAICPVNMDNGFDRDGAIDLGRTGSRFKDLYLSGGIEIENGTGNVGVGKNALQTNTSSYNTAVGSAALYSNTTAAYNTAVGYQAGLTYNGALGSNTFIGFQAGQTSTGDSNTFVGARVITTGKGCGQDMTTGSKNTILGGYSGNQGGLDIRTSSNNIVLSDGDGNPRAWANSSGNWEFGSNNMNSAASERVKIYGQVDGSNQLGLFLAGNANTYTNYGIRFYDTYNTNVVGSVTFNTTSTSYNTSSDYRLKENVVAMTGATDRLKQLNPSRFNFIADADTTVDGFIAHEVQSIIPEAITGTKDAVDADGNPVYQGIDQSKLVPLLVATIQELEARITALENA